MQIREQGKKVQCIRSTYDTTKKRSIQKVVYTFSRYDRGIGAAEELTQEERAEVTEWLKAKNARADESMTKSRLAYSPETVEGITKALKEGDASTLTPERANELWSALDDLRRALRKAGHPHPKPAGKGAQTAPGQQSLIDGSSDS